MTVVRAPAGHTFAGDCTLETHTCPTCGMVYAIPERMGDRAKELGHGKLTWRCPRTGCAERIGYHGKSEEEQENARLKRSLGWAREDAARQTARADQAEASARGQKAAKTRIKNDRERIVKRIKHGVCPCCGRTFKQVAAHMERMHPDYKPEEQG